MALHLLRNSCAIAVLAIFIPLGNAVAGPNSISISPSIGGMSSVRPDFSMRSRDFRNAMPDNSDTNTKKTKKTDSGESGKKKSTGKAKAAKKVAAPVASTPPVSGANLGLSPAGRKLQNLQGKIDVPALGAVQNPAVIPGALVGSGGDAQGLPKSPRDPAGVGPAMNLPGFGEQAGQDARAVGRVTSFIHDYYVGAREPIAPTPSERPAPGGTTVRRWTWDLGGERKVEVQSRPEGDGFTATETQGGPLGLVTLFRFDRNGLPIWSAYHGHGQNGIVTITYYDRSGQPNSWETRDSQGRTIATGRAGPDPFPANPVGTKEGGSGAGTAASGPAPATAGSGAPVNTTQQGGGNTTSKGGGNPTTSSGNTVSSSGNTGDDRNTTSSSKDGSPGNEISEGSPGNDIGPSKDSSQPAEGAAGNRNIFWEKGIVHPGERPKQTARGSDDRNIPSESGVIIQRDGPPTPQELKDAVTQEGLGGPQQAGSGGASAPAVSRFAQPPAGGASPGGAPSTLTGSGLPAEALGGLKPKPGGPAE